MTAARLIDASARSVTYIGAALALGIINASLQGYLFGNVFGWVWTVSAGPLLGLVIAGVIEILPAPTERPQLDIPRVIVSPGFAGGYYYSGPIRPNAICGDPAGCCADRHNQVVQEPASSKQVP